MLNCKCEVAPIVRHINSRLFNGEINIFLDQFHKQLLCEDALDKLNLCLDSHGFKGDVQFVDEHFIYMR